MQIMIQNRGPTPLPIGTTDDGGYEALLPPGIEIALGRDKISNLAMGQKPTVAKLAQLEGIGEGEVPDALKIEYATDIDQWKGRSDPVADTAAMLVWVFVRNVGQDIVTVQVGEQAMTPLNPGEGAEYYGKDYALVTSTGGPGPGPDPGDVTVSGFTAEQDPTVTVTGGEITNGDTIALTATGGDPAAMAKIDGYSGAVYGASGGSARLSNLDLTGQNVAGLTASAVITPVADTSGTINAFSAANPTQVAMDTEDKAMLSVGASITLEALTGDPAAMAAINGQTVTVAAVDPEVTLNLDLSAVDVAALTADFTVE